MSILEITMIGIGLSMDAAAVSMSNAMVYKGTRKIFTLPLFFGLFQAIMPVLGYISGGLFAEFMNKYSGIVVMIILGVLGAKMIYEGLRKHEDAKPPTLSYGKIVTQAVVTSIDAFAVGVGFAALGTNIVSASTLIGAITLAITLGSVFIGRKFGDMLGAKAEILGGSILIIIGAKELFF